MRGNVSTANNGNGNGKDMRKLLDGLYRLSATIAGLSILGICLIVSAQILLNITARLLGPGYSWTIPSYADFAGFMLSGATFLALGPTLRAGGHIRVTLLTGRLPARVALWLEVAVSAAAAILVAYILRYVVQLIGESWRYNDLSPGIIPIPLWIPQSVMALGLVIFLIALVDLVISDIRAGRPTLLTPEEV